jgi:hypothetical protein
VRAFGGIVRSVRARGQPALDDELLGGVDRDVRDPLSLIHPTVALELPLLFLAEGAQVLRFIREEPRTLRNRSRRSRERRDRGVAFLRLLFEKHEEREHQTG